jgi:hypothetical protein
VMNVVSSLPDDMQQMFVEIIGVHSSSLMSSLLEHQEPTLAEREAVEEILSNEFVHWLRPDDEPTDKGRKIDNLLGAFLRRWPIEVEHRTPPPDSTS